MRMNLCITHSTRILTMGFASPVIRTFTTRTSRTLSQKIPEAAIAPFEGHLHSATEMHRAREPRETTKKNNEVIETNSNTHEDEAPNASQRHARRKRMEVVTEVSQVYHESLTAMHRRKRETSFQPTIGGSAVVRFICVDTYHLC
mmetsp:Transcript_32173/g.45748  ORF Transcript_32173/g.45748 Transcript_32173/m.45748 type:complete len:145 (+) Transcript_32173:1-435(+)